MTSERFSLKWNDYQSNWSQSLSGLRNDTEMSDVTLITDDKVKILSHKIILSSCSNIFNFILKESKQSNPLLYLSGISSVNLKFLLDYIYYGEVNLYQEQLDGFIESAKKLEISGLLGGDHKNQDEQETELKDNKTFQEFKLQNNDHQEPREHRLVHIDNKVVKNSKSQYTRTITNNGPKYDVSAMIPAEIADKIKSMYQKIDGVWTCNECGKTTNNSSGDMRLHVETHHGLCYKCNLCSQEFRSKNNFKFHQKTHHNINF